MEPIHTLGPRTTATSAAEQRLKVNAGKHRILRKAVKKARYSKDK